MNSRRFQTIQAMLASALLHGLVVGGALAVFKTSLHSSSAELDPQNLLEVSTAASLRLGSQEMKSHIQKRAVQKPTVKNLQKASVVPAGPGDVVSTELPVVKSEAVESVSESLSDTPAAAGRAAGESARNSWLSEVRLLLERKKEYPLAARRLGHQGRVLVRFVVSRNGQITEAKILEESRSDILNRAARGLIENLGSLRPFPDEIRVSEWAVVVPIEYKM